MGITSSSYTLQPDCICCNGEVEATISLSAAPDILTNPADIVLVLDRSGSMGGSPLVSMKAGADKFIDILDQSTDRQQDGHIGSGSRIAIVSFADTATQNTLFSTSVADLKTAVNSLVAGGETNHADAFTKAVELFDFSNQSQKIIVMFTDGQSTVGGSAVAITDAAKAQGVIIYCIVLAGQDGTNVPAASQWVSTPVASFLSVAPSDADLEDMFEDLASNITKPGATDIQIHAMLSNDFILTEILPPSKGTAFAVNSHTVLWQIDKLGATAPEGAVLHFRMRHVASTSGLKQPLTQLTYTDAENNVVSFPTRSVRTDCPEEVVAEPCPTTVSFTVDGYDDFAQQDLGNFSWESYGHILECSLTLHNICPHRQTALALILTETDDSGQSHPRGFKTFTIPAHHASSCRDIHVKSIRFVLPDDTETSCRVCKNHRLHMQVITHAVESNFHCC